MFRYTDESYNSNRPASSQSNDSPRPLSGPLSPQLNNYLPMANWPQRKKEQDSRSMGGESFNFSHQLPLPQDLMSFHETTTAFASGNNRPSSGKKSPKPDSYKTVMCQAWLESKICTFAENCRFAHGEGDLRPSKVQPKQNSKYKTKLCDKFTTTGLCPYGNRCLFIHPENGGSNAYIRQDKLVELSQRHALTEMNAQKFNSSSMRPSTPEMETFTRPHLRPHPSWPLEPTSSIFKDDDELKSFGLQDLFGCFDSATTPNRVSFTSSLSEYGSGGSSPSSSSSINLTSSEDEERDYFRTTGLEHLAEELTRNLTTTELW